MSVVLVMEEQIGVTSALGQFKPCSFYHWDVIGFTADVFKGKDPDMQLTAQQFIMAESLKMFLINSRWELEVHLSLTLGCGHSTARLCSIT